MQLDYGGDSDTILSTSVAGCLQFVQDVAKYVGASDGPVLSTAQRFSHGVLRLSRRRSSNMSYWKRSRDSVDDILQQRATSNLLRGERRLTDFRTVAELKNDRKKKVVLVTMPRRLKQVASDDVSGWAATDIISRVNKLPRLPPSLGVVSRIKEITLIPSPATREFGFSLLGTFPVKIHQVKHDSPAYDANLGRNDLVVKIDGDAITSLVQARRLADNAVRNGGIKMCVIVAPSSVPDSRSKSPPSTSRVREYVKKLESSRSGQMKAHSFIEKLKELLQDRPAVVEGVVRAIKSYSQERNISLLVSTLSAILDPPEELLILDQLRVFIYRQHRETYDSLVKVALKRKASRVKRSRLKTFEWDSLLPPFGHRNAVVQFDGGQQNFVATLRQVCVHRRGTSFGITLRGDSPVQVHSVDPGSPAEKADLRKGDEILSINGLDITTVSHERAVALLQASGSMPTLVIQTTSGAIASPVSLHQMPCHVSPAIDPQIFTTLENMSVAAKPVNSSRTTGTRKDQNNNSNAATIGSRNTNHNNSTGEGSMKDVEECWTHYFVPPEYEVHGENFDYYLRTLLRTKDKVAMRRAMESYAKNKNLHALVLSVHAILSDPKKWTLWYFVLQSLKTRERLICRAKLIELLQKYSAAVEHSQNSSGDKASDEDIPTNSENRTCIGDTGNARSRIRRRRSERPTYVRSNTSHCISSTVNRQEADLNPPIDETAKNAEIRTTFRVRRRQRRRTVTGLEADDVDSPPRIDSDILRIDESEEDDMSQLVCSLDKLTETIEKSTASVRQDRATDISRRRRRRDPLLRRLQSVESFSKKEVATKSVGTYVTTDETEVTVKPRERRRRSSDGSSFRNSNKPTTELRVTDSKQGNSSSIPVTQIDEVTISDSPPRAETARRRRRSSTASIVVSHDRNSCPQTSIDDIIAHPENDSNSNVNSNTQVSSSYSEDSNETDSSMSLKSPMNRLRSSFRLPKSKSKEHNDAKHVDTKTTGSGDDKGETKKSRKGLLERMGMGKSKQSNAEQKKQSKKSKSSSKKEDKSKDKTTVSKSKSVDAKTTETTKNGLSQTKEESPEQFTDNMFMLNMTTTTPEFLQDDCKPNNLTRRLTFSRPPKNADTETFLNELYAQFDKDMNLLGNLDLDFDSGSQPTNFGSKWSYLPNGSMPDDNSQKVFQPDEGFVRNDLSDLNLSDLEDTVDSTPPFPLNLDSGDESGLGTVETISTPSPVVHASTGTRDRELEWERRERRKRRGRRNTVDTNTSQNEQQYSPQHSVQQQTFQRLHSAPQNSYSSVTSDTQDEENIYQVPKTTTRRSRGNRKQPRADFSRFFSLPSDTSHPPITKVTRRQRYRGYTPDSESGNLWESQSRVADENYVDMPQNNGADQTTSNGSTEQRSFYDRTQKRGFISRDTENVISEPGDSFSSDHDVPDGQHNDFAGEVRDPSDERRRRRRTRDNVPVTHLPATTSGDVYLYVDDKVVYASPHSTQSTAVRLRRRSRKKSDPQQNDDLEGDLSFTDMDSLLKQCEDEMNSDEERPPEVPPLPDSETPPPIPPPPSSDGPGIPPPPIPPPPPPPPPLPPMFNINQSTNSPEHQINVKRINWQKIETRDLNETVWGQMEDFETINDVVKYLDLEQHFATKKAKDLRRFSLPVKRETTSILSHKKAYNISILLAHLKMTVNELRGMLLSSNNNHLDSEQYKQLLMYAPDDDEAAKLLVFKGNVSKLNEADQFARKLVAIPGFKLRLQSLKFKQSFAEREEEVRKNLDHILQASMQLRKSRKLAKILEFVLAMGNYMNRGHNRIAKATGFKIQFLNNMDSTKTSDNKLTFLHILARAVSSKFPELLNFFDDMRDVKPASRVLYPAVFQELQDMRMEWVEIRDRMSETTTKEVRGDRFKSVMENCLVKTNASLKRLELLLTTTIKEFNKVAKFFGENPKTIGMQQFFGIFDGFITKFEKASNEILYIMKNKGNNTGT